MVHNLQTWLHAPVIELQSIDSTNNYAMQIIDADKAQHGMTIIAKEQTAGKGQRGHQWLSEKDENLLMSLIISPEMPIDKQFLFSAAMAVGVCTCIQNLGIPCHIKWPNDLIINDRKAGGILIENILRGSCWMYSVVGIGINVLQKSFPENLPHATSLKKETAKEFELAQMAAAIRQTLLQTLALSIEAPFKEYRQMLYKLHQPQLFTLKGILFTGIVRDVLENGQLVLETADKGIGQYQHGELVWVY